MSEPTKPSILSQVERVIDAQPEGFAAGVLVQDGTVGAEVSAKKDIGKKGGWVIGAVARTNDRFAALLAKWTPKG